MRNINILVVHCSATPPSMDIGAKEIREWHIAKGWKDIGYNYVIRRNGVIEGGRDLDKDGDFDEEVGAHAEGFNANSIGICMVGGTNTKGAPDANFTLAQYNALHGLLQAKSRQYHGCIIKGHRDYSTKACPSFDVQSLMET